MPRHANPGGLLAYPPAMFANVWDVVVPWLDELWADAAVTMQQVGIQRDARGEPLAPQIRAAGYSRRVPFPKPEGYLIRWSFAGWSYGNVPALAERSMTLLLDPRLAQEASGSFSMEQESGQPILDSALLAVTPALDDLYVGVEESTRVRPRKEFLTSLKNTVRHELRHAAQAALAIRAGRSLRSRVGGTSARRVPSRPAHIDELLMGAANIGILQGGTFLDFYVTMDPEFHTLLGDEITTFVALLQEELGENVPPGALTDPGILRAYLQQSSFFARLHQVDRPRWREAVKKFVGYAHFEAARRQAKSTRSP